MPTFAETRAFIAEGVKHFEMVIPNVYSLTTSMKKWVQQTQAKIIVAEDDPLGCRVGFSAVTPERFKPLRGGEGTTYEVGYFVMGSEPYAGTHIFHGEVPDVLTLWLSLRDRQTLHLCATMRQRQLLAAALSGANDLELRARKSLGWL